VTDDRVTVTAGDRRGLLAAVAGCLALHRLEVVTADASTVDGLASVSCAVQPRFGGHPDAGALIADLRRALAGDAGLLRRLARMGRSTAQAPRLVWFPTVLEVRAADSPGLLYRIAQALEDAGVDVRAARISTLGAEVVDAFYLEGSWDRAAVEKAVAGALSG
jgi:[protein-PII] uridylyltransferase